MFKSLFFMISLSFCTTEKPKNLPRPSIEVDPDRKSDEPVSVPKAPKEEKGPEEEPKPHNKEKPEPKKHKEDPLPTPPVPTPPVLKSYNGVDDTFERLHLTSVLGHYTGRGVIAALIDQYVDFNDPALQGKEHPRDSTILQWDIFDPAVNYGPWAPTRVTWTDTMPPRALNDMIFAPQPQGARDPYDIGGHGTDQARILAGTQSSVYITGIAPGARLVSYGSAEMFRFAEAVLHAQSLGASIVNISLITPYPTVYFFILPEEAAVVTQISRLLQDMLIVIIAGNGGNAVAAPMETMEAITGNRHDNFIVTVAVDANNHLTSQSQRCGGARRFCLAIPSTGPTSPTAPIVCGILALLKEAVPGKHAAAYARALLDTATPLGNADETGKGLPNVEAALTHLRSLP